MRTVYTDLAALSHALVVRSHLEFGGIYAFSELLVYKDWKTGTEVHFRIFEAGNPNSARDRWRTMGLTPWAWRYTTLSLTGGLPNLTIVLSRNAQLRVRAFDHQGQEFPFPPQAHHDRVKFSEFTVRWESLNPPQYRPRYCVPSYSMRRPQTAFLPTTERFDRMFELGSSSLLHYPRNLRRIPGEIVVEPVTGATQKELRSQRDRRYSSRRPPRTDTGKGSEYVVASAGAGHRIWSVDGEYSIDIEITDLHKPAAYNFTFTSDEVDKYIFDGNALRQANWDLLQLHVHHGPNVKVSAVAQVQPWKLEARFSISNDSTGEVVALLGGQLPPPDRFRPLHAPFNIGPVLLVIGGLVLLAVPGGWVAGLALSVGELVYTYETGVDFFGNTVSPAEFAAMGILGLVGAALDVRGAVRALSGAAHAITQDVTDGLRVALRQFSDEYDAAARGSLVAVEQAGSDPVVKIIASMSRVQQQALADLGAAGLDPVEYVRRAGELLAEQLESVAATRPEEFDVIVSTIVEGLLTPDGRNLADSYLRSAYDAYRRHRRTKNPVDPISWLWKSKSNGVRQYLESIFGKAYRDVIRRAVDPQGSRHVVVATEANISQVFDFFDEAFKLGIKPYSVLHTMRSAPRFNPIRGLIRNCFEFEHPVELRFVRNLDGKLRVRRVERGKVRWVLDQNPYDYDVKNLFAAHVVARTRRHAALLRGRAVAQSLEESALAYTQHPKTRITAERIPWGAEHLSEPQEIADTVCTTLLEVNFHQLARGPQHARTMMDALEQDFKLMTELINRARGTDYKTPVLTHSLDEVNPALRPGGSWARFSKDDRDVWSIANLDEVTRQRVEREAWADEIRIRGRPR